MDKSCWFKFYFKFDSINDKLAQLQFSKLFWMTAERGLFIHIQISIWTNSKKKLIQLKFELALSLVWDYAIQGTCMPFEDLDSTYERNLDKVWFEFTSI